MRIRTVVEGEQVRGFVHAAPHREAPSYRRSVNTSAFMHPEARDVGWWQKVQQPPTGEPQAPKSPPAER